MGVKNVFNVGIDLGKKSKHVAVVVDNLAKEIGKPFKFNTTAEGIESLIDYLKSIVPEENSFRFIMEPTPTWRLIGTYLLGLGYEVCLVGQAETHDLRKALDRHKRTDRQDALTLARVPFVMPEKIHPAAIPPDEKWDALYRAVKKEQKTAGKIAATKQAVLELAEESIPGITNLIPDLSESLAKIIYADYLDPRKIASFTHETLRIELEQKLGKNIDDITVEPLITLSQEALKLHRFGYISLDSIHEEIHEELMVLSALEMRQQKLQSKNYELYESLDPEKHILSIPGIGKILAPVFLVLSFTVAGMDNSKKLRSYAGFVPNVAKSGLSDKKGTKMTKAGPSWLKRAVFLAAEVARRTDPQLSLVYYRSMTQKGNHHTKAVCEVGVHLLDRVFHVLKNDVSYELRSPEGLPISKEEAQRIIRSRYIVPEEVRKSRRSRKREALGVRDDNRRQLPARQLSSDNKTNTSQITKSSDLELIGAVLGKTFLEKIKKQLDIA